MALATKLIIFPLAVMLISILFQYGTLVANPKQSGGVGFCNPGTQCSGTILCAVDKSVALFHNGTPCFPNGVPNGVSIQCQTGDGQDCFISGPSCFGLQLPPNMYCDLVFGIFQLAGTLSNTGNAGTSSGNQQSFVFVFGALGQSGFIVMAIIAISLAVIAGFQFFGSGIGPEAVRILFLGGTLIGAWAVVSVFEGYPTISSSFFVQLNGVGPNWGTTIYIAFTLAYFIGTVSYISGRASE